METQKVTLGCGTLILIALIVMFFSRGGEETDLDPVLQKLDKIERQLDDIERELVRLKAAA